eukprot:TRINITY_DN5190_c0_g1_i2.p1 TRINITY_DN5190_c0_g1~~TRINITY_DN5190_c0_g1_i2.p1  ORF type:complete len:240 (+),score=51.86 TRINITY_DN5190_c0_g1_i2:84-803(+)
MFAGMREIYPQLMAISQVAVATAKALSDAIFRNQHVRLFSNYLVKYATEDSQQESKFAEFATLNPAHLGLPRRFWLTPKRDVTSTPPYLAAIDVARKLPDCESPVTKAMCMVDIGKAIGDCILSYWDKNQLPPDQLLLGADDFLPIFSFVLIKANVPHVFTECKYTEDFLDEFSMSDELGYAVVTCQTSICFIRCLQQKDIEEATASTKGGAVSDRDWLEQQLVYGLLDLASAQKQVVT